METIDDILREMRSKTAKSKDEAWYDKQKWSELCDRIESAMKHRFREVTKTIPNEVAVAENATTIPTCKDSLQVGNAAKMYEALSDACYAMFNFLKTHYGSCYEEMANALDKAKAALAEPLKNCEVGTVEEQTERFRKFCFAHMKKGGGDFRCHKNCPAKNYIGGWGIPYCQLKWAQMPYEEVK